MILIIFLYGLCASTFTIGKALLEHVKPFFFLGVRMSIAGVLLLLYSFWKNKALFTIQKQDRWLFVQVIFFHVYCAYILDVWSLQYISSSKSSFLYNLSPFIAALLSYFYFSEKMTIKKWLGLCIGFAGFLPEIFLSHNSESPTTFWLSFPECVLLAAVTSAVIGWVILRKLVKERGYSPLEVNGIGMVGGGILAFITSLCAEGWAVNPVMNFWPFVKLTALIIVIGNLIFYNFYGFLLTRYTATFLSFAGFTTPLFAALFGWFFLQETVQWTFFLSIVVVGIGLYIFHQEELKQGYST